MEHHTIHIELNAEPKSISTQTNVQMLVDGLSLPDNNAIAIAVNNAVVPRSQWSSTVFADGDKILMIQAAAGG